MRNIERVNWSEEDINSIEKAERRKAKLENAGYNLIHSSPGLLRGQLVYRKGAAMK